ncbi:2-phospho-L-lactate transferase [Cryobacterium sp. MP_3.1]|uniref:2-phospho-L-lactate transferase n=1 Tax=Cryobacterium sp. MP_3.1 TaxID=3071711 RepID=UPI002E080F23|nr:2-phospho-L-lactate transferase [Cryobacterium sp. MP_3.1]
MTRVTVLAGGVGGARFTRGLLQQLASGDARIGADDPFGGPESALSGDSAQGGTASEVTVIVNTGDDMWLDGLRICPDLDTVMYTLGGGISEEQGWGRPDESRRTSAEIAAYGRGWSWFTLGDLDLATHIVRTDLLRGGATLSAATEFLCRRWQPGARLLPMSDQFVETHVRLAADADEHRAGDLIHFEEWWVRYRAGQPVSEFVQVGLADAVAAPGVIDAILSADLVILPPSNPVVSVGTILSIPGIREALRATTARVVGISPIISGAAVRGMAGTCLTTIGVETSALAVGLHYGSRQRDGVLDAWLVDESDADAVPSLEAAGIRSTAVPLWMSDVAATAQIAAEALRIAADLTAAAHPATRDLPIAEFAFPGPLRDQLVAAILDGSKTSTTSTLIEYGIEDEPLPVIGSRQVLIDSAGRPVAIIETTGMRVVRLGAVDLDHARAEGEGYDSVAAWRVAHESFWQSADMRAYLGDPAFTVTDDTEVVLERLRLIEVLPGA